jgi:hypothetical protein
MILFLKFAVVFMGILIVAGLAIIGVKIYQKSTDVDIVSEVIVADQTDANQVSLVKTIESVQKHNIYRTDIEHLKLGDGLTIREIFVQDTRIVIHAQKLDQTTVLIILDLNTGEVMGQIKLPTVVHGD